MFYKTLEEKMCSLQYFCGGEDVFTPVILVRRRMQVEHTLDKCYNEP
jgi:hypothetical protein